MTANTALTLETVLAVINQNLGFSQLLPHAASLQAITSITKLTSALFVLLLALFALSKLYAFPVQAAIC